MRISDWSSDVCSSDLIQRQEKVGARKRLGPGKGRGEIGWLMMAKVEVYSSMLCGYCYRAKKLLEQKGVAFTEIDVMVNPSRRAEMVQRSGGRSSVPQNFIDDQDRKSTRLNSSH